MVTELDETKLRKEIVRDTIASHFSFHRRDTYLNRNRDFPEYSIFLETEYFPLFVTFYPDKYGTLSASVYVSILSNCCKKPFASSDYLSTYKCQKCEKLFSIEGLQSFQLAFDVTPEGKIEKSDEINRKQLYRWIQQTYTWRYHSNYSELDTFEKIIFTENFTADFEDTLEYIHQKIFNVA